MSRVIKVKVTPNDPDLSYTLEAEGAAGSLTIASDKAAVLYWAQELRTELNAFVQEFTNGNINFSTKTGFKLCREHLNKLAEYGHNMYSKMAKDKDIERKWTEKKMNAWLAQWGTDVTVIFSVPDNLYLPWGLLYNGDHTKLRLDDTEPTMEEYKDFWCIKYRASSFHTNLPARQSADLDESSFRLLSALNDSVYKKAYKVLPTTEQDVVSGFWTDSNPRAFDRVNLKQEWQKVCGDNGILYFYCHANSSNIELSPTDTMSAEELSADLERDAGRDCINLAFFNGCNTLVGPDKPAGATGRSFIEVLLDLYFRGHIGTEAKIPDVFALRFGFDFLFYFLHGKGNLLDAMASLRRKHWPLSLVYSIHCDPLVSIKRKSTPEHPEQLSPENFSHDRVGSNLLAAGVEAA